MGYTNYWTYAEKDSSDKSDELMAFTKKAIELSGVEIGDWDGMGEAKIADGVISLNGVESCETFELMANAEGGKFGFCKTQALPYDVVVKACLMKAMKLGIISTCRFAGEKNDDEYKAAKKLFTGTIKSLEANND